MKDHRDSSTGVYRTWLKDKFRQRGKGKLKTMWDKMRVAIGQDGGGE